MNKKFKFAYSMFELLIVFTLISFLIIYELIIVNRKMNEYGGVYYNAYNTLRKVTYNIFIDTYCPSNSVQPEPGADPDYDCTKGARAFPKDVTELCKRYTEYLNVPNGANFCTEKKEAQGHGNINEKADNISEDTLKFKTTNTFRFYISGTGSNNESPYEYTANGSNDKVEYFIMYVDLNGSKAPNRVDKEVGNKVLPDIVPFAITRKGEVIPMGFPVYSTSYITAKVRYPDEAASDSYKENLSESMSLYDAIAKAWGTADDNIDIPFTFKLNDQLPSDNLAKYYVSQNLIPTSSVSLDSKCKEQTFECKVVIDSDSNVRF